MLKLKLGLAVSSIIIILTGLKLLYGQWMSIDGLAWLLVVVISYTCANSIQKLTTNKKHAIFNGFDKALIAIFLPIVLILAIGRFINTSEISSVIIGLGFITLTVFGGMKFITFDFNKKMIEGLYEEEGILNLTNKIIKINSYEIEIKNSTRDFRVLLKMENYPYKTWILLTENIKKILDNSPYMTTKKKLDEELLHATLSGNWERRQEINLHFLWLETLKNVNNKFGLEKDESETAILATLSFDEIKLPLKWKLNDYYCFPFSTEIISAYGIVLAENDYKGMYKPDSILPVPKNYIRKAFLFCFDYFKLENPIYDVSDKDKRIDLLSESSMFLHISFINTGNDDLPKSVHENLEVGKVLKEKWFKHDELEDIDLVDWRTKPIEM